MYTFSLIPRLLIIIIAPIFKTGSVAWGKRPYNFSFHIGHNYYVIQILAVQTDLYIYICSTRRWNELLVSGLVYGLFGILQTVALYFAFQISKVKVKGLNDAKYTAAVVYVITVLVVILVVTNFVFNWVYYINISASINGIVIWLAGTLILGFMFVPKVSKSSVLSA